MKKICLIFGHHNTKNSFNAAIRDTFIDEATKLGHKIDLINLFDEVEQLPFYRSDIKISNHVACTGCNSAAGLYPILPLVSNAVIDFDNIIINLATGVSGAGRKASESIIHSEVSEGFSKLTPSIFCILLMCITMIS